MRRPAFTRVRTPDEETSRRVAPAEETKWRMRPAKEGVVEAWIKVPTVPVAFTWKSAPKVGEVVAPTMTDFVEVGARKLVFASSHVWPKEEPPDPVMVMGLAPRAVKLVQETPEEQETEVVAAEPSVVTPLVWVKYARPGTAMSEVVAMRN
jgi:hypothetical protein